MDKRRPNISSSPLHPASNGGEPEQLESLANSELISFLESSFRRSEFIRVAGILESRDELAKAEALKDLFSKLSHLKAKNGSLEKELRAMKSNEVVKKMEEKIMKEKGRYLLLRGSYEKMEQTAQEKIRALMEENEEERANCLRLEEHLKLEKARNERIPEIDLWKSKYSKLEAWILRFLENNPHLAQKAKEQDRERQNGDFFRIKSSWRINNADSDKKKSSLSAISKSVAIIDIIDNDVELIGDSLKVKSSAMNSSFHGSDKDCRKRKFQIAQTCGVNGVLDLDDEDDMVCISDLMVKRFAKGIK